MDKWRKFGTLALLIVNKLGRRFVRLSLVIAAIAMALVAVPTAANATPGAGLWPCDPYGDGLTYACTTIKSAPSSGVQVYDHVNGEVITLYNGNSIVLWAWATDTSGLCGINGDSYVWNIEWVNGSNYHSAYIGDYYLNTGSVANWNDYEDYRGNLGNYEHYVGVGSGPCNNFNPTR